MEASDKISFDGWSLDTRSGELRRGAVRRTLSELPLRILVELATHPNEVVTREQLIQRLWPQGVVDFEAGLNTAMRKLRVALEDAGDKPRYIETLPRRGYRFIGSTDAVELAGAETRDASPVYEAQKISSKVRHGMAITVLAVIAITVYFVFRTPSPQSNSVSTRVRMAILPFENLSPDPDHAFFADGLHEQTLRVLAERARDIDVISRTTMTTYKGRSPPALEIASELGATHVFTGAVRRDQGGVRLDVELIDARTDRHLWSHTFERVLTEATTLQSDVAAEVVRQLSGHLENAAAQAKMTQRGSIRSLSKGSASDHIELRGH